MEYINDASESNDDTLQVVEEGHKNSLDSDVLALLNKILLKNWYAEKKDVDIKKIKEAVFGIVLNEEYNPKYISLFVSNLDDKILDKEDMDYMDSKFDEND